MEWVETTAKTLDEAKDLALDRLGVAADEAEFEILEEPRPGLFGRMRGEARVRARVMPTAVRPKQDRRGRGRAKRAESSRKERGSRRSGGGSGAVESSSASASTAAADDSSDVPSDESAHASAPAEQGERSRDGRSSRSRNRRSSSSKERSSQSKEQKEQQVNHEDAHEPDVSPEQVGEAAAAFMSGLAEAFGASAETEVDIEGSDIEVRVSGAELGLMVGHGGRTLMAVQDLARVASQRRLGDHDTRLRIDVGGYREKRRAALERFAAAVANEVIESGESKALEPMQSADRKIVHDALAGIDGVSSRSEGDDPMRRVVISPA